MTYTVPVRTLTKVKILIKNFDIPKKAIHSARKFASFAKLHELEKSSNETSDKEDYDKMVGYSTRIYVSYVGSYILDPYQSRGKHEEEVQGEIVKAQSNSKLLTPNYGTEPSTTSTHTE